MAKFKHSFHMFLSAQNVALFDLFKSKVKFRSVATQWISTARPLPPPHHPKQAPTAGQQRALLDRNFRMCVFVCGGGVFV